MDRWFQPLALLLALGFGARRFGLAPLVGSLLLLGVVRMALFVVVTARAAEKEQNWLSVGAAHTLSVQNWQVVVKRTIVAP